MADVKRISRKGAKGAKKTKEGIFFFGLLCALCAFA
jgi:hypothetical protein